MQKNISSRMDPLASPDDGNLRRDPKQVHRRQRGKNIAVGLCLAGLIGLVYLTSLVKMGVI
jgi:hypothetical protein